MFQANKYIPKKFDDSFFHKEIINMLKIISKDESIPHLLFAGPKGSGKKTLINLLLNEMYGEDINNLKTNIYQINGSCNKTIEIPINQSNYHIIITPNNNNFDKYVIQTVIKKYAKLKSFDFFRTKHNFKIVLINNVDTLPYYAQASLRRTMEKYSNSCRFILCADSLTKVIDPLVSRCMVMNLSKPVSGNTLYNFVKHILKNENIVLSDRHIKEIINNNDLNIKDILWTIDEIKIKFKLWNNIDESLNTKNQINKVKYILSVLNNEKIDLSFEDFCKLNKNNEDEIKYELFKFVKIKSSLITYEKKMDQIIELIKEINYNKISKNIMTYKLNETIIHEILNFILIHSNIRLDKKIFNEIKNKSDNCDDIIKLINNKTQKKIKIDEKTLIFFITKIILNINVSEITKKLYTMFVANISFIEILRDMIKKIMNDNSIGEQEKYKILQSASIISHNLTRSRRDIIHMDYFINEIIKILNE